MAIAQSKKVLLRLDPSYKRCPSCRDVNTLRRSRAKNLFENILKFTGIYKVYRCRKCNWRGPLSTIIVTKNTVKNIAIYAAVIWFALYVVSRVISSLDK